MAGLGDTLRNLSKLRAAQDAMWGGLVHPTRLTVIAPRGSNPGALRMLGYVPPGLPAGAPLVVVLHGCGQNASGYDHGSGWSALADRHGFALLFPEQERANNGNLCLNWFQPGDVTRGEGEVLSIRQMIDQMITTYRLNPARVYITGLSAGGAMTAAMLATYPEVFAGGAIIAGLPYGAARNMQEAIDAMHHVRQRAPKQWGDLVRNASPHRGPWPHVQVWHGDADTVVHPGHATELIKQWADVHGLRQPPETGRVDGVTHSHWRRSDGLVVLESYSVPGMAHGTPLSAESADMDQSAGAVGPYMLEAGISSTWRIAQSWGLLTQAARPRRTQQRITPTTRPALATKVSKVVENALRAAGL